MVLTGPHSSAGAGVGAGQHDPEVDAETARSSAALEEQAKAGVVGPREARIVLPLVASSHGPSPQGSSSQGSRPCGITPNPTPVLKQFPPDRGETGLEQVSS